MDKNNWIKVEDRLPTKDDTSAELANHVLCLERGFKTPRLHQYHMVKHIPFISYWMPLQAPVPSPECTKDPNTCQVAFCNWNKCLIPEQ